MRIIFGALLVSTLSTLAIANDGHNALMSKSNIERTKALGGLLNASGKACVPTADFFQGFDKDKAAYWNVACSNGKSYNVQIANDEKHQAES